MTACAGILFSRLLSWSPQEHETWFPSCIQLCKLACRVIQQAPGSLSCCILSIAEMARGMVGRFQLENPGFTSVVWHKVQRLTWHVLKVREKLN
jgi:hypothetical protein